MSGVQGSETKGDAEIYILCVLVNIILACLLLMQCCSMHMVPGGAGHVWFIRCVPTHTGRGLSCQLSVFLSEGVCRVSPLHWLTAGVTDRPPGTGAFPLMADVEIWHSLNLAHVLTEWKHISAECVRGFIAHAEAHLDILMSFLHHIHTHTHVNYLWIMIYCVT